MENNIPKKPNLGNKLPAGHELRWNSETQRWAIYPIPGYSQMYLSKDKNHFVPKTKKTECKNLGSETKKSNNGDNANANLHKARNEKNDEFYTRLDDISAELKHYKEHFKGKVVYCPCDKVYNDGRSNFFVYFATFFEELGLKAVICTQYNPNPGEHGIKWVYTGDKNGNGVPDESEIETIFLKGDGDFASDECRQIMKECDIVVTNPPFSLFRPFVTQLMELGKKFLIIGNMNAITYSEVFPFIKANKIWLGYRTLGSDMFFQITDDYKKQIVKEKKEGSGWKVINGEVMGRVANACWFTNLEHSKRKEFLYLAGKYKGNEDKYPVYGNYGAIEIGHYTKNGKWQGSIEEIPSDYDGVMGVPITFLGQYNPEQFEIIGCADADVLPTGWSGMTSEFVELYYKQGNTGQYKEGNRLTHYVSPDGKAMVPFKRILIRRKK